MSVSCSDPSLLLFAVYRRTLLQDLQSQMPVEWRLTLTLPQKVQVYRACWEISIFLTCLRREAP